MAKNTSWLNENVYDRVVAYESSNVPIEFAYSPVDGFNYMRLPDDDVAEDQWINLSAHIVTKYLNYPWPINELTSKTLDYDGQLIRFPLYHPQYSPFAQLTFHLDAAGTLGLKTDEVTACLLGFKHNAKLPTLSKKYLIAGVNCFCRSFTPEKTPNCTGADQLDAFIKHRYGRCDQEIFHFPNIGDENFKNELLCTYD